jgi:hypothetical protein
MSGPPIFPFMTWVPERTPRFKTHESPGQAQKAILFRLEEEDETLRTDCRIYKWAGTDWELLHEIKQGTNRKDMPWL